MDASHGVGLIPNPKSVSYAHNSLTCVLLVAGTCFGTIHDLLLVNIIGDFSSLES